MKNVWQKKGEPGIEQGGIFLGCHCVKNQKDYTHFWANWAKISGRIFASVAFWAQKRNRA